MSAGHPSGSTLYAGIFKTPAGDAIASSKVTAPPSSGASLALEAGRPSLGGDSAAATGLTNSAVPSSSGQPWSAALRFAPRSKSGSGAAGKPKPKVLASSAVATTTLPAPPVAVSAAAPRPSRMQSTSVHDANQVLSDKGPAVPATSSKLTAPVPSLLGPPPLTLPPEEIEADRTLARAAAEARGEKRPQDDTDEPEDGYDMDDDINGFYSTEKGKRSRNKKKKRRRGHSPGAISCVHMDADYDPRVPNDYAAFKELLRTRRRMTREKRQEDVARRGDQSSEYESDEQEPDETRLPKTLYKGFAPPPTYNASTARAGIPKVDDEKPYLSPPPTAMPMPSVGMPDDQDQQRTQTSSADEIYARRLALTQALQQQMQTLSSPAGPALAPPGCPPSAPSTSTYEAQKSAAAAIAAKLSQMQGSKPDKPPAFQPAAAATSLTATDTDEAKHRPDPAGFAARLMEKYGYKKGEGIGAQGNKGIVQPLEASKAEQGAQQRRYALPHGNADDANTKANLHAMGKIVNNNADPRQEEEQRRFGDPSETILLENMVAVEDIDDELQDEIREECSKHGIVERVFIYPVPAQAEVLIFVRYSGPVGAWKAVRDLDGRFFGGRKVRARYYPTVRFDHGDYLA
ncbi:hypothetical protein K437DRAFT_276499, partial [Tilletiaria anomala UBC 951]